MAEIDDPASPTKTLADPSGYKPKPPLWEPTKAKGASRFPVVATVVLSVLVLAGIILDTAFFSGPAVATPVTIVAIEGFQPVTHDTSEFTTYVLKLPDGRQARLVSTRRHLVGTKLTAMVSKSRITGRLVVSSTYMLYLK